MSIPFTQYLRPDGRKKAVTIELEVHVEAKANDILAAGYVFEIEQLINGMISATIADPIKDRDVAHALSPNGPPVPIRISEMIMSFKLPKEPNNDGTTDRSETISSD